MGSPFLILESDVHEVTLIPTQGLNYYIRRLQWGHSSEPRRD